MSCYTGANNKIIRLDYTLARGLDIFLDHISPERLIGLSHDQMRFLNFTMKKGILLYLVIKICLYSVYSLSIDYNIKTICHVMTQAILGKYESKTRNFNVLFVSKGKQYSTRCENLLCKQMLNISGVQRRIIFTFPNSAIAQLK